MVRSGLSPYSYRPCRAHKENPLNINVLRGSLVAGVGLKKYETLDHYIDLDDEYEQQ